MLRSLGIQLRKFKLLFLSVVLLVLILWQIFSPGYILTMDMVFAPEVQPLFSKNAFTNSTPLFYLLEIINLIIPTWLIQKIVLISIFLLSGILAYKFLPVPNRPNIRIFAALVYMLNPFVYVRLLAGHWHLLLGYSLLPLFLHLLFNFAARPSLKSSLKLFASMALINIFSLHLFAITLMISVVFLLCHLLYQITKQLIKSRVSRNPESAGHLSLLIKNTLIGGLILAAISLYWLVPAFTRTAVLEQKFGPEHWSAFAAAGHHGHLGLINSNSTTLGPLTNLATLNGFWAEKTPWASRFLWPQDQPLFWIGFAGIFILTLIAIFQAVKGMLVKDIESDNKVKQHEVKQQQGEANGHALNRTAVIFFAVIAGAVFLILATGASQTIFKPLNIWLYENIPFWSGFRDSQKFISILAVSYAILGAYGLDFVLSKIKTTQAHLYAIAASVTALFIPVFLGILMWFGLRGQLKPVWYPQAWHDAKKIITSEDTKRGRAQDNQSKILILPWHGYMAFAFNNNLIIANPGREFFGRRAITSKNVELGGIYDQEQDSSYQSIDRAIRHSNFYNIEPTLKLFKQQNITYIIHFQNLKLDEFSYDFLQSTRLKLLTENQELRLFKLDVD